jgi:hypothetical protein
VDLPRVRGENAVGEGEGLFGRPVSLLYVPHFLKGVSEVFQERDGCTLFCGLCFCEGLTRHSSWNDGWMKVAYALDLEGD